MTSTVVSLKYILFFCDLFVLVLYLFFFYNGKWVLFLEVYFHIKDISFCVYTMHIYVYIIITQLSYLIHP